MEVEKVNFKKLFPDKKDSQKRFLDFFDKKGFYIVLVLCVVVIGVTALLVTSHNITSSKNYVGEDLISPEMASNISTDNDEIDLNFSGLNKDIDVAAKVDATPLKNEKSPETKATPDKKGIPEDKAKSEPKSQPTAKPTVAEPNKDNKPSGSTAQSSPVSGSAQSFMMPVFGEVSFEFSNDKLVYSKTLDEWRTHSGIDIKADRGTEVKVVADGVVTEIKNDPRLGITVVVEHGKKIKTVYANLASDDVVTPNQMLKQGDVVGAVGNTAKFESAEPAHLHFEVLKNNEPIDPVGYLPQKTIVTKTEE